MGNRPTREFDFELPVGYMDEDGRVHRTATLRKMSGHEEAMLADRKLRQNAGKLVTELLTSCTKKLDDVPTVNRQLIAELTSPDRNYLLLELRKITFGETIEANYRCPACGGTNHILEELDELPVSRADSGGPPEITVELEDGYEDKNGEVYMTMSFRLPTGVDEEKTANIVKSNASRGTNALLSRCMLGLGDMPTNRREALGTKILGDLTMGDRARIERAFRQEMPGVDLTRELTCEHCGSPIKTTLDMKSFFSLPSAV